MIYFIKSGPFVRIGHTNGTVDKKVEHLRYGSPYPLVVLGTRDGDLVDETHLHRQLAAYQFRGDWFHMQREILLIPEIRDHPGMMLLPQKCYDHEFVVADRKHAMFWRESKGELLRENLYIAETWGRDFNLEYDDDDCYAIRVSGPGTLGYVADADDAIASRRHAIAYSNYAPRW